MTLTLINTQYSILNFHKETKLKRNVQETNSKCDKYMNSNINNEKVKTLAIHFVQISQYKVVYEDTVFKF